MPIVKHWLYGAIKLNVLVERDDNCGKCMHREVCTYDTAKFCNNYIFSTSEGHGCQGCINRYSKWDSKQPVPCFSCKHFKEEVRE